MEILGIGPTEFLFIVIILLLVLGPSDLVELGQKTGRMIRKLRDSETWIIVSNLARTMRNLPTTLADETGSEEILREVLPDRYRKPIQNLSMEGAEEKAPPAPSDQKVNPPEAEAYSSWTNPAPPPVQPEPDIQQEISDTSSK